nr:MAG TPA: hypothetical protein [Caudoviricetes sp.]
MEWDDINHMSLGELEETASKLYREANYRIARLGAKRVESEAYKRLASYIGSPYLQEGEYLQFKIPETGDALQKVNQLRQSISVLEKFMAAKTSTVKGIEKVKRNRRKWIRQNFDGFTRNKDADDFLKFLGTDEIKEQKKTYDSNIVVEALAIGSKNQPSKKLKEIYNNFKKSKKSWGGFLIEQEQEYKKKKGIKF